MGLPVVPPLSEYGRHTARRIAEVTREERGLRPCPESGVVCAHRLGCRPALAAPGREPRVDSGPTLTSHAARPFESWAYGHRDPAVSSSARRDDCLKRVSLFCPAPALRPLLPNAPPANAVSANDGDLNKIARPEPFFLNGAKSDLCVLVASRLSADLVAFARACGLRCEAETEIWRQATPPPGTAPEDLVRFLQPVLLPTVEWVVDEFFRLHPPSGKA